MAYTIYALQNTVNKKIYIGKSENVITRLQSHISTLKCGKHPIPDMQKDFDKYGDVFEIHILEENVPWEDRLKEYKYMKKYKTYIREYGYNYKDHIARKIIFNKSPKMVMGTANSILFEEENPTKTEYIKEIAKLINKIDDISLLDLIHKMLQKADSGENLDDE